MNAICSNMGGSRNYHIKSSKSDRERQIWDHLYVKSKKNYTSELLSFYFKNEEYVHRAVWKRNQGILIH